MADVEVCFKLWDGWKQDIDITFKSNEETVRQPLSSKTIYADDPTIYSPNKMSST